MGKQIPTSVERPEVQPREPLPVYSPKPKPRRSLAWLWLLILAAAGYAGFRYYQASQRQRQAAAAAQAARSAPRAVPVVAVPARGGDMPVYVRGLGTVTAFNTVAVKSRVDGQLVAIHFTEGQFVKQGGLLAEIDPRPFQVQLEQAGGQLARDQAQLNDAQVNAGRYQTLWQQKVIAKQQLDTQVAQVGQYEGTIEADKAAIDNARLQLTYAKITAPISGRTGLRQVDAGNIIHATDANGIVVITQMQPIAVLFTTPSDNLPPVLSRLRAGTPLRVEAWDRDDRVRIATGTLLTVDNQIDQTTGTARMKAVFGNRDNMLFPNQFVNCRMLLETRRGVVIVPAPAIQRGPQGTYVYVVTPDNTAGLRVVTVGITEGNEVSIESGLHAGENVVTDGQDKLREGTTVDARPPRAGAAPGGARRPGA